MDRMTLFPQDGAKKKEQFPATSIQNGEEDEGPHKTLVATASLHAFEGGLCPLETRDEGLLPLQLRVQVHQVGADAGQQVAGSPPPVVGGVMWCGRVWCGEM